MAAELFGEERSHQTDCGRTAAEVRRIVAPSTRGPTLFNAPNSRRSIPLRVPPPTMWPRVPWPCATRHPNSGSSPPASPQNRHARAIPDSIDPDRRESPIEASTTVHIAPWLPGSQIAIASDEALPGPCIDSQGVVDINPSSVAILIQSFVPASPEPRHQV